MNTSFQKFEDRCYRQKKRGEICLVVAWAKRNTPSPPPHRSLCALQQELELAPEVMKEEELSRTAQ
jgi:hypothetical protein